MGLVVFHQSNHDIDTNDVALNRETISFEVYGVEWARRDILVQLGLYYDRGTRLDGTLQNWPFNYYLAGTTMAGEWPLGNRWFGGGQITVIAHRNKSTPIPHTTIGGHVEGGLRLTGDTGILRVFLRYTRLTDYPFLGASPQHMISVGLGFVPRHFPKAGCGFAQGRSDTHYTLRLNHKTSCVSVGADRITHHKGPIYETHDRSHICSDYVTFAHDRIGRLCLGLVAGKAAHLNGKGQVYDKLDKQFAGGVEADRIDGHRLAYG